MDNFYTNATMKDSRFHSIECCKDLGLLEPITRASVQTIIAAAAKLGKTLVVLETYRSPARQQYLFTKRVTQLRKVGVHGYSLAADLGLENPNYDGNGEHYLFLRNLAEEAGMISGIDWGTPNQSHSFRDWDHIQRVAVSRQNSLFAGTWYPDENYKPLDDLGHRVPTPIDRPVH